MTIHSEHPFREPDSDQVRRLRGRVGATVSLWTSGTTSGRAGLTVSSYVVVTGDPGRIVAALDPDSGLVDVLRKSGTGVVQLLRWEDRAVADAFAGTMPAPGGPFRTAAFVDTDYGPRLAAATSWAGVRLEEEREVGWSTLVTVTVAEVHLGDNEDWLVHRGGRYQRPAGH